MRLELEAEGYQPRRGGLILVQALIAFLFCLLVVRFWYMQVLSGEELSRLAHRNRIRLERIPATRGLIMDAQGRLLAENRSAFCLALNRDDCPDVEATLAKMSEWLNVPYADMLASFKKEAQIVKPFDPLVLATDLPFELLSKIEDELRLWPGVQVVTRQRRSYPQGELFAHVIGYMNKPTEQELAEDSDLSLGDAVGKTGLEMILDRPSSRKKLRGKKGMQEVEVNVRGRQLNRSELEAPVGGDIISLSLDIDIQRAALEALGEHSGTVVVMNPDTGKIKALVSNPSYDNNVIQDRKKWEAIEKDPRHPLFHRAIQSAYPPGSIWKLLIAGLLLKEGVNPQQTVVCTGEVALGNHTFRCWKKGGHGVVNMQRSLVESCDVYYYEMGKRIGIDKISAFAEACGFGKPTGVELSPEGVGIAPSRAWKLKRTGEAWQVGETLNVSIGQGSTMTTPLQMANFVSALVNGGRLFKPSVLSHTPPFETTLLPLTQEQCDFILNAMRQTVDSGTAKVLKRPDAIIGGKTGTAQVVKIGEQRLKTHEMAYEHRDHAWIASWGEKEGVRYVVIGMVEHGGGGSTVAGPVVRKVYDYLFGEGMKQPPSKNVALEHREQ